MSFDSVAFLFFFPLATTLYFLCPHRFRTGLLLAASAFFYMSFVPSYILILLTTICVDYVAGRVINSSRGTTKHLCLVVSIFVNVGFLAFFKYFNFINENLALAARFFHQPYPIAAMSILLPIGLSFHTFQAMSYTVEVYRGRQKAEQDFWVFALYVLFYPQLVAGPIERPQNLLHQFREKHVFEYERVMSGLKLMAWGFFKKVVVANGMAQLVNPIYAKPEGLPGSTLLFATVCFSFQIYADFSGYTDIARGAARVMGFSLMMNFRNPYLSGSMSEFWTRWHISLSTWFRDYVYFPLGGNRVPFWRWQLNLLIVFMISGLWHGAKWTFVIWGLFHAALLITEHCWVWVRDHLGLKTGVGKIPAGLRHGASVALVFVVVTLGWIFFRAQDATQAFYIFSHLGDHLSVKAVRTLFKGPFIWVLLGSAVFLLAAETQRVRDWYQAAIVPSAARRWTSYYLLACAIVFFGTFGDHPFIYFQF